MASIIWGNAGEVLAALPDCKRPPAALNFPLVRENDLASLRKDLRHESGALTATAEDTRRRLTAAPKAFGSGRSLVEAPPVLPVAS